MSQSSAETKLKEIETFIKLFVKTEFGTGADIDDVPSMRIDGLNGQAGLYINFATIKSVNKIFWSGQFTKMSKDMPTVPTVLVDTGAPDKGGTLWMGVLFHEYGHAAMDKLKKNSEPAAYTVELLSLLDYVGKYGEAAEKVKIFVRDRRKQKQYTGFLPGYEAAAQKGVRKSGGREALATLPQRPGRIGASSRGGRPPRAGADVIRPSPKTPARRRSRNPRAATPWGTAG